MEGRSILAEWRNALRDSDLNRAAKVTGYALSTYANGRGEAFPSKDTLAAGTGTSKRTVDAAIATLEGQGFLHVDRSAGRKSNRYRLLNRAAVAGLTVQELQGSETANHATGAIEPCKTEPPTVQPLHPKAVESEKEGCTAPRPTKKERDRAAREALAQLSANGFTVPKLRDTDDIEDLFAA